MENLKLGKRAARKDLRTLKLARYLPIHLPPPPQSVDWSRGQKDWGMMENDNLGDCTIAAIAHAIQVWTANTTTEVTVPNPEVVDYYSRWAGYDPKRPETDNGAVELDILNLWRKGDFAGHKLLAYADPAPMNVIHVKQSIILFGGLYIGLSLPVSAQDQEIWDIRGHDGGPWGGHAVYVIGYDQKTLTCITWGKLKKMTWQFWLRYCDESHTLIGEDWMKHFPASRLEDLMGDLQSVTG